MEPMIADFTEMSDGRGRPPVLGEGQLRVHRSFPDWPPPWLSLTSFPTVGHSLVFRDTSLSSFLLVLLLPRVPCSSSRFVAALVAFKVQDPCVGKDGGQDLFLYLSGRKIRSRVFRESELVSDDGSVPVWDLSLSLSQVQCARHTQAVILVRLI